MNLFNTPNTKYCQTINGTKNRKTVITLTAQSTKHVELQKNIETCLYYLKKAGKREVCLIGDSEQAEVFILDGIKEAIQYLKSKENKTEQETQILKYYGANNH